MTKEEAIKILHPDTMGAYNKELIDEAKIVACDAMEKLIKLEVYLNELSEPSTAL